MGQFGATDANIPVHVVKELETIIASTSQCASNIIIVDGVGHGFAHRGGETPQALLARTQMVDWLQRHTHTL